MQQNPDNALVFESSNYVFQADIGVDTKSVKALINIPPYIHG